MNQINAQSLSPVTMRLAPKGHTLCADGEARIIAHVYGVNEGSTANARLFRASFNAFDKAGRELGLDAATLAEGIDLAALIRLARGAANIIADEYPHTDGRKFTGTRLRAMLDKICTP